MRTPGQRHPGAIAMRTRAFTLLVLAGVLLPALALGQPPDLTGSVVISMRGTLAPDESTANNMGWGGISFGFTGDNAGKTRWFGVVHATTLGGNSFDAKSAVFRAHYNPTLIVAGPPALAKQLLALPDGTRVQLEGVVELGGSRNILLDLVKPLSAK
jgi:hypothetical protein